MEYILNKKMNFYDFIIKLKNIDNNIKTILIVTYILVSFGILGVDEELLVSISLMIVFILLFEMLKNVIIKEVESNCILIWEFLNYELLGTRNVLIKYGSNILYFNLIRIRYKIVYIFSIYLLNSIKMWSYISGIILKYIYILNIQNLIYKYILMENIVKKNFYEKMYNLIKLKKIINKIEKKNKKQISIFKKEKRNKKKNIKIKNNKKEEKENINFKKMEKKNIKLEKKITKKK